MNDIAGKIIKSKFFIEQSEKKQLFNYIYMSTFCFGYNLNYNYHHHWLGTEKFVENEGKWLKKGK